MSRRERRKFTKEFKQQMVNLYNSGETQIAIIREDDLTPSSLDRWIRQSKQSGSFSKIFQKEQ